MAALPTHDVTLDVHGGLLTSPARTVVDCARSLPGHDALAIADAALRRRLVSKVDLEACLAAMPRWPGVAAARLVIDLADGLRESPLESWSAWAFHVVGLPRPRWQVVIDDPELGRSYRVDCLWDGGLVGEADGRTKAVLRAAESRGATADAMAKLLADERQREGRLRALGHDVVRWGTRDVLDPGPRVRLSLLIASHLGAVDRAGLAGHRVPDAATRRPAC